MRIEVALVDSFVTSKIVRYVKLSIYDLFDYDWIVNNFIDVIRRIIKTKSVAEVVFAFATFAVAADDYNDVFVPSADFF